MFVNGVSEKMRATQIKEFHSYILPLVLLLLLLLLLLSIEQQPTVVVL
jgi:hypothetical protein